MNKRLFLKVLIGATVTLSLPFATSTVQATLKSVPVWVRRITPQTHITGTPWMVAYVVDRSAFGNVWRYFVLEEKKPNEERLALLDFVATKAFLRMGVL